MTPQGWSRLNYHTRAVPKLVSYRLCGVTVTLVADNC